MIHLNLWFLMQALTTQGVKSLVHGNTNSLLGCVYCKESKGLVSFHLKTVKELDMKCD